MVEIPPLSVTQGYLEVADPASTIVQPIIHRIQYAWIDPNVPDFNGNRDLWSGQFAPIDEWVEYDHPRFRQYAERMRNDPVYRQRQLEAQKQLFTIQNEVPRWVSEAASIYIRLQEQVDTIEYLPLDSFRDLLDNTHNYLDLTSQRMRFLGAEINFREIDLLQELFRYPNDRITELVADYKRRLQAHRHYSNHVLHSNTHIPRAEPIPVLSEEELKAADASALKLLRSVLTPLEAEALIKKGEVKIPSSQSDCIYLVRRKPSARIQIQKNGKPEKELCVYFRHLMHPDDVVLAKIMMVKHDEEKLLTTANIF